MNTGKNKLDPLPEDMPLLEDMSGDEGIVVETPTADDEIMIEIP